MTSEKARRYEPRKQAIVAMATPRDPWILACRTWWLRIAISWALQADGHRTGLLQWTPCAKPAMLRTLFALVVQPDRVLSSKGSRHMQQVT